MSAPCWRSSPTEVLPGPAKQGRPLRCCRGAFPLPSIYLQGTGHAPNTKYAFGNRLVRQPSLERNSQAPAGTSNATEKELCIMGFIAFLILGLIAGAIAKLILPGDQAGGWITTMVLGVIGALLGGWVGSAVFGVGLENFWSIQTWIVAIIGSIVVLLIWGLVTRNRRTV